MTRAGVLSPRERDVARLVARGHDDEGKTHRAAG
jgi:hypothetical protein